MIVPKQPLAQLVIQLCRDKGISNIIISPGSRNAPLTIGFANDDFFECYSIVDERSAAFFGLGIAQQLQTPVVLLCTSGSAMLNYYPAIAEAYYSHIPLIVISADRPAHLIGVGDGQTINQKHAFGSHILYEANLSESTSPSFFGLKTSNSKKVNRALNTALNNSGPVHINIPFDEPLYETVSAYTIFPKNEPNTLVPTDLKIPQRFIKQWQSSGKIMILVGVNPPNAIEASVLESLAQFPSVIVLTETTSNLNHEKFFSSIDQFIAPLTDSELLDLKPDVLITFGGLIVSKKIKAFLRASRLKNHWHIDPLNALDTFFGLKQHFKCSANTFFKQLLAHSPKQDSDYFEIWYKKRCDQLLKHQDYIDRIPFSDFKAFEIILGHIPTNYMIQSGNSSTIRYLQLFKLDPSWSIFCNRGTSGIDGSTSTAVGAAVVAKRPTLLITGDLSFFYDSNGLWNQYIPSSFRILLINNKGGGIFRILPGHKDKSYFSTYFETNHQLSAKNLASHFGFEYQHASDQDELHSELSTFFETSDSPKLLEIATPSKENDTILLSYFEALK